jgi:CheY-like chemotaxis protein
LEDEGHRVFVAMNGRQALQRLGSDRIDVILLDFMMPVLDGPETLAELRAAEHTRDIPVIMMSSIDENVAQRRAQGYDVFMRKPFSITELDEAIARVLER